MTESTEQFAELTERGHQVFTAAVRAWEDAARSLVEAARRPGGTLPDVQASLDAAFDFAAQMLADQRDFAKKVLTAGARIVPAGAETAQAPAASDSRPSPAESS